VNCRVLLILKEAAHIVTMVLHRVKEHGHNQPHVSCSLKPTSSLTKTTKETDLAFKKYIQIKWLVARREIIFYEYFNNREK
jgi:hypothetical protein